MICMTLPILCYCLDNKQLQAQNNYLLYTKFRRKHYKNSILCGIWYKPDCLCRGNNFPLLEQTGLENFRLFNPNPHFADNVAAIVKAQRLDIPILPFSKDKELFVFLLRQSTLCDNFPFVAFRGAFQRLFHRLVKGVILHLGDCHRLNPPIAFSNLERRRAMCSRETVGINVAVDVDVFHFEYSFCAEIKQ